MEFVRLPFGLVNACSACAQLMKIVLRGLENVTFYFDNIYAYGKTFEDHSVALEQVLTRLELHGLTVRPSKCHFGFPTINLGLTPKARCCNSHNKSEDHKNHR